MYEDDVPVYIGNDEDSSRSESDHVVESEYRQVQMEEDFSSDAEGDCDDDCDSISTRSHRSNKSNVGNMDDETVDEICGLTRTDAVGGQNANHMDSI